LMFPVCREVFMPSKLLSIGEWCIEKLWLN